MGSFAHAYRDVVNRPLDYAIIMLNFFILATLSVLAPMGIVGLFSLITSYSTIGSTIISLAGIAVYAAIFLLLGSGSYGALFKALDERRGGRNMGLAEMADYALRSCLGLAMIKAVELALIAFFAIIIFATLYLFNIDLTRKLYLGIGIAVLGIPALLIKYLFSLAPVSFVKSGGILRSIAKSFKISILRALNYLPVCILAAVIMLTLIVPFINLLTFFVLYPIAISALIREYEKLLI
jgi:hypothetical protein